MFDQVDGVTYTINSMKNRVLLTMLIIFIVVAGICITCGTIFVVREVEVDATTLSEPEKKQIVEQSGLCGKNILFGLNEEQIAKKIKKVDPMFKLQSAIAKFPNRVVLTISRRSPIYYATIGGRNLLFDADMCVVEGDTTDCVDITAAGLSLSNNLAVGDLAVAQNKNDQRTQGKIRQLKALANYYGNSLKDYQISYNDNTGVVDSKLLCLDLKIDAQVTFELKIKPNENFLHALKFTEKIHQTYPQNRVCVYETMYHADKSNKVGTQILDSDNHNLVIQNGKEVVFYEK